MGIHRISKAALEVIANAVGFSKTLKQVCRDTFFETIRGN